MAKYRKVDPRVWDDEKFVEWDDLKRNLWLLLLTGPAVEPVPGLQLGGVASLAETLRRPLETVQGRFTTLSLEGRVQVDERFRIIRVVRALEYNRPENQYQVFGWFKAWESLPNSQLKYDHIDSIREACAKADQSYKPTKKKGKSNAKEESSSPFMDAFRASFGTVSQTVPQTVTPTVTPTVPSTVRGSRARTRLEQEQEQEQEQEGIDPEVLSNDKTNSPGGGSAVDQKVTEGNEPERGLPGMVIPASKSKKPRQTKLRLQPDSQGVMVLMLFEPMFKAKYGYDYTKLDGDVKAMSRVYRRAAEHATNSPEETKNPERVVTHWLESFLADNDPFLEAEAHKLRFVEARLNKYGLPWAKPNGKPTTKQLEYVWAMWLKAYEACPREYGPYIRTSDCERAMSDVIGAAKAATKDLCGGDEVKHRKLTALLLGHWFQQYLREDGREKYLVGMRHPLKFLPKHAQEFGVPDALLAGAVDRKQAHEQFVQARKEAMG